jgi:hypothetical protein
MINKKGIIIEILTPSTNIEGITSFSGRSKKELENWLENEYFYVIKNKYNYNR